MLDDFSELKFFHSFRIRVEEVDQVRFLVERETGIDRYEYIDDGKVIDVSATGIGLTTAEHLFVGQELRFSIQFRKMRIEVEGRVIRSLVSEEEEKEGKMIYGVRLEDVQEMNDFIKRYISSLPVERLRDCLEGLALEDRRSMKGGPSELFSLLVSLFRGIGTLTSKRELIPIIFREAASILEAEKFAVFLIDPESNELQAVEALGLEGRELKCYFRKGIAGSVFTSGSSINIETSEDKIRLSAMPEGVRSVICHPIQNGKDKVVGVIEAINKKREKRFQREDEEIMRICSIIFGIIFDRYEPFAKHSEVRSFSHSFDRKYALIGRSKALKALRKAIVSLKDLDGPVLIGGEEGVGKSLLAQIIHTEGIHSLGVLETLDCRYLSDEEMEDALFGPENVVEKTRGGGLLFKNVHGLSQNIQNRLAHFLEEREKAQNLSALGPRIFLTTNEDLEKKVSNGTFHPQLFGLISKAIVHIPPLRERNEDIKDLVLYFLKLECRKQGLLLKAFSEGLLEKFALYSFPQNVRELRRYVSTAVTLNPKNHVISELDEVTMTKLSKEVGVPRFFDHLPTALYGKIALKDRVALVEGKMIEGEIRRLRGNKSRAAREMGISRETLRKKMAAAQRVLNRLGQGLSGEKADRHHDKIGEKKSA
ncbi:MAG: sigma 54-interacting transcriptional regulator [Bacteriovoracales bacterium]|nr:sigma 54-interacting transcriptional regulator [Bacteriovoracales bacterium]